MKETQVFTILTRELSTEDLYLFYSHLDAREKQKALRFRLQRDCDSYVAVHGLLRMILGSRLEIPPRSVSLEYNRYGKPMLISDRAPLYFSLSHSRDISIVALTSNGEVGADIEYIDPEFDFREISSAFFVKEENEYIDHGRPGDRERFYRLWTRKEALLKAIGTGLSGDLAVNVTGDSVSPEHFRDAANPRIPSRFLLNSAGFRDQYMITVASGESCNLSEARIIAKAFTELITY